MANVIQQGSERATAHAKVIAETAKAEAAKAEAAAKVAETAKAETETEVIKPKLPAPPK